MDANGKYTQTGLDSTMDSEQSLSPAGDALMIDHQRLRR